MSEMSDMFKLVNAMELAKTARVGMSLTYFDVIELLGELDSLKTCIAELEAERRWIPVSERLPEDRATILVAFTEYPEQIDILTATYYKRYEGFGGIDNWWNIEGWHSGNATHWMPLPESPNDTQTETFVYGKDSKPIPCPFCGEIVKECNDVATPIDVALRKRIAELEGKIDQLTAHSDIERQDDKCSKPEPNVCEACGGDGTVLLTDGYKGQVIATAKCIYCNGTGRVNKECEE